MAVFRIDKTKDYTVMSNHHLRDKRLSLKAKGLLSQMLSLPEDWDYTLAGLSFINRESKDAIRTAINELEKAGYIERHQTTDAAGRFSSNEYIIHEFPIDPAPSLEKPTTDTVRAQAEAEKDAEPSLEAPLSDNPTTAQSLLAYPLSEKPMAVFTLPENPTQLNTNKQIKEKQITDSSITHSFFLSEEAPSAERRTDGRTLRAEIRDRIEYDFLSADVDKRILDELVEIMVEVDMNRSPSIRIGRDKEYSTEYVQDIFARIERVHIEKVLEGISKNTTRVWNTKAYLMAALFNSVSTIDSHYTMLVHHDEYGGE